MGFVAPLQSLNGKHVYPNGAEELKAHPFFIGIPWHHMHLTQPPFVPTVRENQPITKYFEDEQEIVTDDSSSYISMKGNVDSTTSESQVKEVMGRHYDKYKAERRTKEKIELGMQECPDEQYDFLREKMGSRFEHFKAHRKNEVRPLQLRKGIDPDAALAASIKKPKEKKRARDKILRDPKLGKKVMELRKKGAFLGYTYRRPKSLFLDEAVQWGRPASLRPTIIPVNP